MPDPEPAGRDRREPPLARVLFGWVLGLLLLTLVLAASLVLVWEQRFLEGNLRQQGEALAKALAVSGASGDPPAALDAALANMGDLRAVELRGGGGRVLWRYGPPADIVRQGADSVVVVERRVVVPEAGGETPVNATVVLSAHRARLHLIEVAARMTLALGGGLALALVLGVFVIRRLTEPIGRLAAWADRFDVKDPHAAPGVGGSREVRELAAAFDRLLARLGEESRALAASERRFRELFQASPAPLLVVDDQGDVVRANRAAEPFLGGDGSVEDGRSLGDLVEDPHGLIAGNGVDEVRWRLPDGATAPVEVHVRGGLGPSGEGALLALHDLTDRLRLAGERWRRTFDAMVDGVVVLDRSGGVVVANRAAEPHLSSGLDGIVERFEAGRFETWERRVVDETYEMRLEPGPDGGAVAVIRDVTGRVRAERRVREAVRAEAVAGLAAGVAHDFNNLLSAVLLQVRLLEKDPAGHDEAAEAIRTLAEQGVDVVRQLLDSAREADGEREAVELGAFADETASFLRFLLEPKIGLELEVADRPIAVRAQPVELRRILFNLVINAREALVGRDDGRVSLRIRKEQNRALLEVADNGPGIPEELRGRVFEPYVSGGEDDRRFGLGLPAVAAIVAGLDGTVRADQGPEGGARFRIALPLEADVG